MVDDYELLPQKDIIKLKHELEELKESNISKIPPDKVEQLNNNIIDLIGLIKTCSDEMRFEETDLYSQRLNLIINKLNTLIEENKRIAEGIIAVADLIKRESETHAQPVPQSIKAHELPTGGPIPTQPLPSQAFQPRARFERVPMPPIPPPPTFSPPSKKKKLFGFV